MFTDVVTLFTHMGEREDGSACYLKTVIDGALVRVSDGVKQYPRRNLESEDRAVVYFRLGRSGAGARFVPEEEFDEAERAAGDFTVRTDGRDRLFHGCTAEETPPLGKGTYRPVSVLVYGKGSERARHIKVVCR